MTHIADTKCGNESAKADSAFLGSRVVAVPRDLCTQDLLASVASVTGGLTVVNGAGIWVDGNNSPVVESVTLLLVSGQGLSVRRAVAIIQRHLAANGEEAVYVLDAGLAQIVYLNPSRSQTGSRLSSRSDRALGRRDEDA